MEKPEITNKEQPIHIEQCNRQFYMQYNEQTRHNINTYNEQVRHNLTTNNEQVQLNLAIFNETTRHNLALEHQSAKPIRMNQFTICFNFIIILILLFFQFFY